MDSKRLRVAAALLACIVIAAAGFYGLRHHHTARVVRAGDRLPALAVNDLQGAPVSLAPDRGVTVYNVFTSWCPSCIAETPEFAKASARLRARGVRLVGIDQGESPAAVSAFIQRYGLTYPVLVDTTHVTNAVLGARVIPETVVVKDGIVKAIAVGPVTMQQLDEMIGTV